MSKYTPLELELKHARKDIVNYTFFEIEKILQTNLPPTARKKPEWWSNNPSGHSQALAWLTAGFKTEKIDLAGETLVFRRIAKTLPETAKPQESEKYHPLFGAMKGQVTIEDGYDLTAPSGEIWTAAKG